jgi:polar amino acid transport system substrate-binding protein
MRIIFFSSLKILIISFFAVTYTFNNLSAEENIIRLGYSDSEAFPFQMRDDNNPPGIAFEIISEAAKLIGIKIQYIRLPNRRVQLSLREGDAIDGAFMFSYSEERDINGVYPSINSKPDGKRRIATLSYYIYRKKGSSINWDGKNFSGVETSDPEVKIGANSGYSVVNDLIKKGVSVDDGSKNTGQNFLKLQTGRIAAFAHQDLVADNYISSEDITGIEKLPKPFIQKDYFLMFSHQYYTKNHQTAEKLWNKIGEIRDKKTASTASKYKE